MKQSLWALAAALLFSLMAAFVKLTSDQLGTLELVFYRSIFGVLSIGFFVWKSGLSVKTPYLGGHIKRSVLGTLSVALWFYTLGKLPFGTNMTLIYTTPLFMAANFIILALMKHQRAPWALVGAIVAGFAGIVIVLQPSFSNDDLIPALICLSVSLVLIILADPVKAEQVDNWSLNRLLKSFDASYTKDYQNYKNRRHIGLALSEQWIPWEMGSDSLPIRAYREYGKGRIAVGTALDDFLSNGEAGSAFVDQIMDWLCEKQVPVGGEPRLPQTMGGGGAIYPELESVINGMVTYYAPTVNHTLLECIKKEFFKINDTLLQWYPSRQTEEPMFLVLSAGSGGGWAVNSFFPKENGIISQDSASLISIYGHELAHTLAGPVNEKGQAAGDVPFGNQGEAHAGWFQGKVEALYNEELRQHANKKCEDFFRSSEFDKLDLKRYTNDGEYAKQFSYGAGWYKLWYIWQRLDDTYGNTWYARWKHIQYTRWKNDPMRLLTWEEMIEDMSLATGHDLFPFFISLNTSLERREMGEVIYEGKKVKLSGAVIPIIEPGNVCLNPIENYKTIKFE